MKYLSLKDVCSGDHNLKLDKRALYLMTFACQFGRYRFKGLLFGPVSAADIFQQNIYRIFKDLPNVFGIADDILIVGYDSKLKGP